MKKRELLHQGDVQLIETTSMPQNAKAIEKRPIALGEISGHQHVITGEYDLFEDDKENVFAAVGSKGALLQHIHESQFLGFDTTEKLPVADHSIITLNPNKIYKIGIHKQYDPFQKIFKKVID